MSNLLRMLFSYMSPDPGTEGGGGGGTPAFDPAAAKTFLTEFVPDPKVLDTMDEAGLKGYHQRVTQTLDKVRPAGKWPDKWRESYADGDDKKVSRLAKYPSPSDAFNALLAAQNKISEAGLKEPFPAKGTVDEQNAWRAANNVPEASDKYDLKFEDGFVIGDEDKDRTASFLKSAHALHLPNDVAKNLIRWSYAQQEAEITAQNEADKTLASATQEALRSEWGADYKGNMNVIHGLLDLAGDPELKNKIMGGRLADGTPLFADVGALKWLAQLAREINPVSTLVPAGTGDIGAAIGDEIANIEKLMGNKKSDYWIGPKAEKMQERYRQLIDARDKQKNKAA